MFSQAESFYLKRSPLSADTPGSTARWRDSAPYFQLSKHMLSHTHTHNARNRKRLHKLSHGQHAHRCFKLNWGIDRFLCFLRKQTSKQQLFFSLSGLSLATFVDLSGCDVTPWTVLHIIHLFHFKRKKGKKLLMCTVMNSGCGLLRTQFYTAAMTQRTLEGGAETGLVAGQLLHRQKNSTCHCLCNQEKVDTPLWPFWMTDARQFFCLYMRWFI